MVLASGTELNLYLETVVLWLAVGVVLIYKVQAPIASPSRFLNVVGEMKRSVPHLAVGQAGGYVISVSGFGDYYAAAADVLYLR